MQYGVLLINYLFFFILFITSLHATQIPIVPLDGSAHNNHDNNRNTLAQSHHEHTVINTNTNSNTNTITEMISAANLKHTGKETERGDLQTGILASLLSISSSATDTDSNTTDHSPTKALPIGKLLLFAHVYEHHSIHKLGRAIFSITILFFQAHIGSCICLSMDMPSHCSA